MKINLKLILILQIILVVSNPVVAQQKNKLADKIKKDQYFPFVKSKALEVMKTGFNAGDGYREVWIRDYNTFIQLAAQVNEKAILKENLLVFFRMQGDDGNIIDGFTPIKEIGKEEYDFIYSKLEPRYAGHKNSVETDQESSLVQALYKYVAITGDQTILEEKIEDKNVGERLEFAMDFLINQRFNQKYGLLIGATTADWGDVQPEHGWGVDLDANTHPAIDIYDNAMFVIALGNMMELLPKTKDKWAKIRNRISENCRKYLWDTKNQKFIPHLYLEKGSPFPADFDENKIYYFGGTAIAIEAGLLNKKEIKNALEEMVKRVKLAGAGSIGLTLYPPYPKDFFVNKIMNPEYSYQNGGDWTWFGGRMIQQLIRNGFVEEAYEQMIPMVKRVKDNNGFFEWYSVDNKPRGSGTFRGEAGVLFTAITMFEDWAK
jgi:GH15 family glucan-1,4-alpha-glucosidase